VILGDLEADARTLTADGDMEVAPRQNRMCALITVVHQSTNKDPLRSGGRTSEDLTEGEPGVNELVNAACN